MLGRFLPVLSALASAFFLGITTPADKFLLSYFSPLLNAGLMYLGSGLALVLIRLVTDKAWVVPKIPLKEWGYLILTLFFGGIIAPFLFMYGLSHSKASSSALMLNLETVFTVFLALVVFREKIGLKGLLGMGLILSGGIILSWKSNSFSLHTFTTLGNLSLILACFCWGIDNNITRKIVQADLLFVVCFKALIAGIVNIFIAYQLGQRFPPDKILTLAALFCGFLGYGLTTLLYMVSLRRLGVSRTSAYYAVGPFIGAGASIVFFKETPTFHFWLALAVMAVGIMIQLADTREYLESN